MTKIKMKVDPEPIDFGFFDALEPDTVAPSAPPPAPDGFDKLVENGLDFLQRSLSEVKKNPKYSVIHFSSGIELLLKARLLHEHWSLVVVKPGEITKQQFLSGDFESVSPRKCMERIEQ